MDVRVAGGKAFIASKIFGLSTLDVVIPADPLLLGSADIPFSGKNISISGTLAVITGADSTGKAHLWVVDISDEAYPSVLGELATSMPAFWDVALNSTATMAVVAAGTQGILVVDLNNPAAPTVIGTYDTPGTAYGVALNSNSTIAYVADGTEGLKILSLSNPRSPALLGSLRLSGLCWNDVELYGTTVACLLNQQGSLQTVDVSIPSAPLILGTRGLYGFGREIAVDTATHKVAVLSQTSTDLLEIISIANPSQPLHEGYTAVTALAGTANGIDLVNGYAYVAAGSDGLKIYKVTPAITLNYSIPLPGNASDATVYSSYAYTTGFPATTCVIRLP